MFLLALTPETSDFYTVSGFWIGVIGRVVGGVGFGLAIWQILETKKVSKEAKEAATAAKEAAEKTLAESKEAYERFVGAFASRLLADLDSAMQAKNWQLAGVRARDLAELLASLPGGSEAATQLVADLRKAAYKFADKPTDADPKFDRAKWKTLILNVHARLDALRAPFREKHDGETDSTPFRTETPSDRSVVAREDERGTGELGKGEGS